ncbi:G-protein coupled receptor 171 isoform X1 [Cygnus atratus]|uniref:G-protein coupled receptor 171 isoform X1 n=2 Tax=Cygnus atratus TaxID=8868 RepID=UPI0015D5C2D7|nr:G-protein coupled receptor 171 isoform X1 [Cygnus atratus]
MQTEKATVTVFLTLQKPQKHTPNCGSPHPRSHRCACPAPPAAPFCHRSRHSTRSRPRAGELPPAAGVSPASDACARERKQQRHPWVVPRTLTSFWHLSSRFLISPDSKTNAHKKFTMSNVSQCYIKTEMEPFTYFYYLIFLMGFLGSCFALWAFTQKGQKQKCMSIYLTNLLTADFLLTLALPVKIIVDLGVASWKLRIFHCQVTACFIYLNMYLSIIFLGFVSMDRCLQLMHSCKIYRIQEPGFAKMLSAVVWTMVLLITVPNMAIPIKTIEERPNAGCIDFKTKFGRDWHVFTNFVCTAIFLNFSAVILISNFLVVRQLYRNKYSESYANVKKALINILLVTAGYILCFVPYHIVRIPYTLSQNDAITNCSLKQRLFQAKESTLLFAVSNLCFDPILYYHLSNSFKLKVTETFIAPKETKAFTDEEPEHRNKQQVQTYGF